MHLAAIVAMSENRVIGQHNRLPWHLPADLRHFKAITLDKPILMGRKTYQSIGRALPNRCNVIITRDMNFDAPGCVVVDSIETALDAVAYSDEVFVIGGAQLYEQLLPRTQRIYMTIVHHQFEGDAYFPVLNHAEWRELERNDYVADGQNPYAYSFIILEKVNV